MKKYLLIALSMVLVAALSVAGTLAYLQFQTPTDVNVMTLGNVKIEQLEYERATDKDGNWITSTTKDKYGYYPDELQPFSQAKPLYPAVFADGVIKWDDRNGSQNASGDGSHQQSWAQIGASGSNQLFDSSVKNVQDKFVFVKNTGKNGAYVRTWIALEQGSVATDNFKNIIMTNSNGNHWSFEVADTEVVIGDSTYYVMCATYLGPKSNPTGILAPGTVSYPSFLQVYMKPEATNEDVVAIDGNGNGTYDILVLSQAVQADGFDDATTALNAAFTDQIPWSNTAPAIPAVVDTADELAKALEEGGEIILTDDIEGSFVIPADKEVTLNLNGKNLTYGGTPSGGNPPMALINNGKLVIEGEGTISADYAAFYNTGIVEINGGTFESASGFGMITDNIYGTETATTVINGGTFQGIGVYNPTHLTINNAVINVGRDPDGATDFISDKIALFICPTFAYVEQTATVILNGGNVNGNVYVYSDGSTTTTFENNGAVITGSIMTNDD